MWASRLAAKLKKPLQVLNRYSIIIGMVALGILTLTVVVDVTTRAVLSWSVPGNLDIVGLLLLIVMFCAYGYSELKGEHIQVSVITDRLPPTINKVITTSGYLMTFIISTMIAWQLFVQTGFLKSGNFWTAVLHIPEWPFVLLIGLFMILFMASLLVSILKLFAELLAIDRIKAYLWLLPGIVVTSGFLVLSLWPSLIPFEMSLGIWGAVVCTLLFVLIFLKVHIAAVMALMSLFGLSYISGAEGGLANLSMSAVAVGTEYTWSVVPLFLWMGLLIYYGGFAKDLYVFSYRWLGRLPGGLASATVGACTCLAALTGDALPGVLTMGVIALPQMREYKYDMKLSTATICTASTIGILIPPSLGFIVYGMLTGVSIGKLFIAGILPGILFSGILIAMITFMCWRNPKLGPPGPQSTWGEKLISLKNVWSVALLVMFCLGGIYMGIFTPTEAGALGAFGALVISVVLRRLSFKNLISSMIETLGMNGICMFIFIFAIGFSHFLASTNLPYDLADWIIRLGLSPYAIISLMLFIYMILGCLMNAIPAVIITLPIFFPIAMAAGFDGVWFGVVVVVMIQLGQITPPIGMNVFAMAAIAKDVPMYSIFRGVLPFWVAFIFLTIILVIFPEICTFLPSLMY